MLAWIIQSTLHKPFKPGNRCGGWPPPPLGRHAGGGNSSRRGEPPAWPADHRERPDRTDEEGAAESKLGIPVWKHFLDIACLVMALPVWFPLMLLIALFIKVVSPGPVLFRQERVGFRGKTFMCLKFRSMKVNADTKAHEDHLKRLLESNRPMTKMDETGDPRLIPFGRLLRASGLDELPQLFNVLRRDMSLVGPRPCTPYELQHYQPWHRERLNSLPGLTGNWQINGKNRTTFDEMIDMDIAYVNGMSLGWDLRIMLKTFPALVRQVSESRAMRPCRNELNTGIWRRT
jgi:exopolysaccharide production protein ExoY